MKYTNSLVKYSRHNTIEIKIGNLLLGGQNPVRVQTMLNTVTGDTEASVQQAIRCIKAGAEMVRLTAQGEKEAYNLQNIKNRLKQLGYDVPLVADVHFNPKVAEIAAEVVEKVRINPGNYTDKKRLKPDQMDEDAYQAEVERIEQRLAPLLETCKKHGTALRIGTNHGSLSDRIMGRFGDTPEGMAESAMEFLRICAKHGFSNIVLSMKASNTRIMVYANRLLVKKMKEEGMHFPIHLGVTEAGDGEDGRIKSALGIGALLADGIGDTIRVSLTEDPEAEIPVAKAIVAHFKDLEVHGFIDDIGLNPVNPFLFHRRESRQVVNIGGAVCPVVIATVQGRVADEPLLKSLGYTLEEGLWRRGDLSPDYLLFEDGLQGVPPGLENRCIVKSPLHKQTPGTVPLFVLDEVFESPVWDGQLCFIEAACHQLGQNSIGKLKVIPNAVLLLHTPNIYRMAALRAAVIRLMDQNGNIPVIFHCDYPQISPETVQIAAPCDLGALFIDGLGDGLCITATGVSAPYLANLSFQILQASGDRITRTEFIACPSCGRTNFNLMETLARVKEKTSHLKGLKIGVMGCIVNGPGEMADAHYGYVGAGRGQVTLYKGRQVMKRAVPEHHAVGELIKLIKEHGDWVEK